MKTTYTDKKLQAAIDEACLEIFQSQKEKIGGTIYIGPHTTSPVWKAESPARLALARALLARLPAVQEPTVKPEHATFTSHGRTWTRHTEGDVMPCEGEALVNWLLAHEVEGGYTPREIKASELLWQYVYAWRYADEPSPAKLVPPPRPWQPDVGFVVKLKSGGPDMTINAVESMDNFDAVWISPDGFLQAASFHSACLTPCTKEITTN